MASPYDEEERLGQEDLFGSGDDDEISDLDGDQPSDNDETETAAIEKQFNEQEAAQQEAEQAEFEQEEETTRASSKLPSFKKKSRENNEEERARLEEVRREIREMKKSTSRDDDEQDKPVDPQQALRDEIDREFAKALSGGKKKKRRRDGEDLEHAMDDELSSLRDRMRNACEKDAISNGNRQPALAKLKMLNEVTGTLTNKHLQDLILDNGLLDTIRLWLEPLPDRSLPSLDIQVAMLDILDRLPISGEHLRESGVGKIVYFYTKSPRIEQHIKRKADQLVAKWSRLVIKRSENYKERRHTVQELRHEDLVQKRRRYKPQDEPEEERAGSSRMHVRIPQAVAADYDIVPQSIIRTDKNRNTKADNTFRRLNNTMRTIKTGPKRTTPKVSIEGKDMSI
ncbi:hypothetical protein G6F57_007284 [Rhizopus arrhizus]|uniref:TFIIS N-terminal domain-containing protein n=1 Tax=Rhizopus oryzae TaxID=64495 RepID=A0A9P7BRQ1_RHIOR|nr:hypothetical protein G6F23_002304 [Rhizopus arrhizus]KAG1422064.1 hypothetical protein G6F58_003455 [Rhizopus delemar]KAG0762192.1 hypothetical protein G6F24_006983 [Rhizopus arrhizus]KAG0788795.1 hypothetical protein G6F21_006965 [Rhizopus arrhizus]KAG0797701.1 hypothetical protein G6F22_004633 [Rhizopus arrhizus]